MNEEARLKRAGEMVEELAKKGATPEELEQFFAHNKLDKKAVADAMYGSQGKDPADMSFDERWETGNQTWGDQAYDVAGGVGAGLVRNVPNVLGMPADIEKGVLGAADQVAGWVNPEWEGALKDRKAIQNIWPTSDQIETTVEDAVGAQLYDPRGTAGQIANTVAGSVALPGGIAARAASKGTKIGSAIKGALKYGAAPAAGGYTGAQIDRAMGGKGYVGGLAGGMATTAAVKAAGQTMKGAVKDPKIAKDAEFLRKKGMQHQTAAMRTGNQKVRENEAKVVDTSQESANKIYGQVDDAHQSASNVMLQDAIPKGVKGLDKWKKTDGTKIKLDGKDGALEGIGKAIDKEFADVFGSTQFRPSPKLLTKVEKLAERVKQMTGEKAPPIVRGLAKEMRDVMGPSGKIKGSSWAKRRNELNRLASNAFKQQNNELGGAIADIIRTIDKAAEAPLAPAMKSRLKEARRAYMNHDTIARARSTKAGSKEDYIDANAVDTASLGKSTSKKAYGTREKTDLEKIAKKATTVLRQAPKRATGNEVSYSNTAMRGGGLAAMGTKGAGANAPTTAMGAIAGAVGSVGSRMGMNARRNYLYSNPKGQSAVVDGFAPSITKPNVLLDPRLQGLIEAGRQSQLRDKRR